MARGRAAARRRDLIGYAFLAPWLIGFLCFSLGPVLASLYLSFTKFDLLSPARWIGTENYMRMFSADPRFWQALKVTFSYMAMEVPLKLAFALAIAVALDKAVRAGSLYRALFYIPSLLGGSVAIAVLWRQMFEGNGTLNQVLLWLFGFKGPSWISTPDTALYTLVLLAVWQFGSPMIIFLAGLRQVPQDLYEAASMDGAGAWRRFRDITLPLMFPAVLAGTLLAFTFSFDDVIISLFVQRPGTSTLPIHILSSFKPGLKGDVAAIVVITLGVSLIGIMTAALLLMRGERRGRAFGGMLE